MKKPAPTPTVINRRARYDYELGDDLVVGLSLTGPEVKAARLGHVQLRGAYVTIRNGELWLNNAAFSVLINQKGNSGKAVDDRTRRLLAHKKEIDKLAAAKKQGMTVVPTKLLTNGKFIKIVIALGKGKKRWDKRETIKRRDQERETRK